MSRREACGGCSVLDPVVPCPPRVGFVEPLSAFRRKVATLGLLADDDLDSLSALGAGEVALPRRRLIVKAGAPLEAAYVIERGWAMEYKVTAAGDRQIIDFLLPGDTMGLDAIAFRYATSEVVALTDVGACAIPRPKLEALKREQPALAFALLACARQERAVLAERLVDLGRRTAYERICCLLLEIWWRLRIAGAVTERTFAFPLDQTLLSDALGLSPTHVNRTLRRIEEDGLVRMHYQAPRRISMLSEQGLVLAAGFDRGYLDPNESLLRGPGRR